MDPSRPQRRRHLRRRVELAARVRAGEREVPAVAENISPGGAFLRVRLLASDLRIVAVIQLPDGNRLAVGARVRWWRPEPPGVGVQFETFERPR